MEEQATHEPSPTIRGPLGSANTAAFLPPQRVYSFTREAITGSTVVIQVTDPFDRDAERHRYSLMGLTVSLELLSCYSPPAPELVSAGVPDWARYVGDTGVMKYALTNCLGTLAAIPTERRRFFATVRDLEAAGFRLTDQFDCQR